MPIGNGTPMTFDQFAAEMDAATERVNSAPIARDRREPIVQALYRGVRANFMDGSAADGTPWPPHKPSTIARHGPHPLLILSGKLLAASTSSGAGGIFEEASDRSLVIGNTIVYAAVQQYGYAAKNIPPRPYFDAPEPILQEVENIAADYLAGVI